MPTVGVATAFGGSANTLAAAELGAANQRNTRSIARSEDVLQANGDYAGEDQYAEVREAIIRHSAHLVTI